MVAIVLLGFSTCWGFDIRKSFFTRSCMFLYSIHESQNKIDISIYATIFQA